MGSSGTYEIETQTRHLSNNTCLSRQWQTWNLNPGLAPEIMWEILPQLYENLGFLTHCQDQAPVEEVKRQPSGQSYASVKQKVAPATEI